MKHKKREIEGQISKSLGGFSNFFTPQNHETAKEALRIITETANSEQKAVIMSFRSAKSVHFC